MARSKAPKPSGSKSRVPEILMPCSLNDDRRFMAMALHLAERAAGEGEVPVGAVVVYEGRVVGRGRNQVEGRKDASRHAEMIALRQAAARLKRWRLIGCTLYSTLEPCAMCAGAAVLFRLDRLVFAARDPRAGACGSVFDIVSSRRLNHRMEVSHGLLERESSELLKNFFKKKRKGDPRGSP